MSTGIGAGGGTGGGGPAHSPFRSGAGFGTYQSNDRHSNNGGTGQRQSYGGDGSPHEFTAAMRDRQARGKDPYNRRESWENRTVPRTSSGYDWGAPLEDVPSKEPYAAQERRALAATVLDSPELLMMHAQSSGDSIPATRLRFTRMLCGYDGDAIDDERSARSNAGSSKKSSGGSRRSDSKWQSNSATAM